MDGNTSDSEKDDEDEDKPGSARPILQLHKVAHEGCINRMRAMLQSPQICGSWGDTGYVQLWDFSSHLNFLAESETDISLGESSVLNEAPLSVFKHKDEGDAIDWSPLVPGRIVCGDCKNCIYLWEPPSGIVLIATHMLGTLQWSPTEPNVFASCSVDGNVAIWGARLGKSLAVCFKARDRDVNVISWNWPASCMLASGSDDGTFSIHDLRLLKEQIKQCNSNLPPPRQKFNSRVLDTHGIYLPSGVILRLICLPLLNLSPKIMPDKCRFLHYQLENMVSFLSSSWAIMKDGDSVVSHFQHHKRAITSIEWSLHEASTLAGSSADNQLIIWDLSLERDEEEEAEFRAQTEDKVNAPQDLPPQLSLFTRGKRT
ncbi:hypothetical protein Ancab_027331 [Ancistrocladus abbreviatus]